MSFGNALKADHPFPLLIEDISPSNRSNTAKPDALAFFENLIETSAIAVHFLVSVLSSAFRYRASAIIQITGNTATNLISRSVWRFGIKPAFDSSRTACKEWDGNRDKESFAHGASYLIFESSSSGGL